MSYNKIQRLLAIAFAAITATAAYGDDLSDALAGCKTYREALLTKDGNASWNAIDSKTQEFYNSAARLALGASRQELQKADMIMKLTVLRCRVEFGRDAIAKMSGRELFSEGVRRGWISRSSAEALKDLVAVKNDSSSASFALPNKPAIPVIFVTKQEGQWRVALWRVFGQGNQLMRTTAKENGFSEDEFVIELLKSVTDQKLDDKLWDGPIKTDGEQATPVQPPPAPTPK